MKFLAEVKPSYNKQLAAILGMKLSVTLYEAERRQVAGVIVLLFCICLLSSCYSYRPHVDRTLKKEFLNTEPQKAYIVNQSNYPKEYKILRKSKLYSISGDSTCPIKLQLKGLKRTSWFMCVTGPVTVLIATLGQYPVKLPEDYIFEIEKIENGVKSKIEYQIQIDKRLWLWDMFSWKKSSSDAIAIALRKTIAVNHFSAEKQQLTTASMQ